MMRSASGRSFRFSLRTLFVVVTIAAIVAGYCGWALNWVREREQFLDEHKILINMSFDSGPEQGVADQGGDAPRWLRRFGEEGFRELLIWEGTDADLAEARALFPEAIVIDSRDPPTFEEIYQQLLKSLDGTHLSADDFEP
jgi:hypothetical protein